VLAARAALEPRIGAIMAAPVIGERGVRGVLLVCRGKETGSFEVAELDLIATFAAQAGLVLELAEVRRDNERLRLLEDRQRIAGDLQNTVIRDLFSLGLSLQSIAGRATNEGLRRAVCGQVDRLDHVIRDVREAIFALDRASSTTTPGDTPGITHPPAGRDSGQPT
jgi:signal transduction histidine kinase